MDVDAVETVKGEVEDNVKPKRARRKTTKDGMPLLRDDLQYDFLSAVVSSDKAVFSDPYQDGKKVTFRDLYVSALLHAKGTKAVRDRMLESDTFATDYAMLSILANVGRISSSMAFFPEARTANRTYHPIPALQRTDGGLTDGQRVRNTLKSLTLPGQAAEDVPHTPSAVLLQKEAGRVPSSNIFQLLFVLNNHSTAVGYAHFQAADSEFEFSDLFRPVNVPSAERANAFLWLCYHYLEPSSPEHGNPFSVPSSEGDATETVSSQRAPPLRKRTSEEWAALPPENVDTAEEKAWAEKMAEHRRAILDKDNNASKEKHDAVNTLDDASEVGSGTPAQEPTHPSSPPPDSSASVLMIKPPGVTEDSLDSEARPKKRRRRTNKATKETETSGRLILTVPPQASRKRKPKETTTGETEIMNDTGPTQQTIVFEPNVSSDPSAIPSSTSGRGRGGGRGRRGGRRGAKQNAPVETHLPIPPAQPQIHHVAPTARPYQPPYEVYRSASPEQTMLQYCWYKITATDPLVDSDDDEAPGDHHTYLDYSRRLQTLNRLTGKSATPTPPPELEHEFVREVVVPIKERKRNGGGRMKLGGSTVQRAAATTTPVVLDEEWP